MPLPYEEFDLSGVRTYPLERRPSKARALDFARPVARGSSFKTWFDSLPAILGAEDLRRAARALVAAKAQGNALVWGLGAHVIKAALEKAGLEPGEIEYVIMGEVLQAGVGQAPARQAAIGAGLPKELPADTINVEVPDVRQPAPQDTALPRSPAERERADDETRRELKASGAI